MTVSLDSYYFFYNGKLVIFRPKYSNSKNHYHTIISFRDNIIVSFVLQYQFHLKSFQKFCETEQLTDIICSISTLLKLQKEQMSEVI